MQLELGLKPWWEHDLFRSLKPEVVEKFRAFHAENPHIYELFKRYAGQLRAAGRGNYGSHAIIERIRWHTNVETTDDEFKISNNHHVCYSRLLMIDDPGYIGFFRIHHAPAGLPPAGYTFAGSYQ